MAYADQEMGSSKIATIVIVALIHIVVIYGLVTGLAYDVVNQVVEKLEAVDIKEEKPPEEPPPPPPEQQQVTPPPIVAPPPPISLPRPAPQVQTQQTVPDRVFVPTPVAAPPPPPPPPPPGPSKAKGASPKGNPGNWATANDYPSRALREEREGTTGFRVTIGPDGRVTGCTVTSSSGSPDLDDAACKNITRRARFNPALDAAGNPIAATYANSVRWVIPK